MNRDPPYGTCRPKAGAALLIALARHTPLGRGALRKALLRLLRVRGGGPYDVQALGLRLRCRLGDNTSETKMLLRPDRYAPVEFACLRRVLVPGSTFVDIGANVGVFSLLAAGLTGPRGKVLAVEPHPEAFDRLTFNAHANQFDQIIACRMAVSDKEGSVRFHADPGEIGNSRIARGETEDEGGVMEVPCSPLLDILLDRLFDRIDALKIDVEGHEDSVLLPFFDGAPAALWPRLVIIEAPGDAPPAAAIAKMRSLGYRVIARTRANVCLQRPPPEAPAG